MTGSRLHLNSTHDLPAVSENVDPRSLFFTRAGLYAWREFGDWILSHALPSMATALTVSSYDLRKALHDSEIRAELPAGHTFPDVSVFCIHLAGMLTRQWGGTDGPLLTNGRANIFYVETPGGVFVVSVCWLVGREEWHIFTKKVGLNRWDEGRRVFTHKAAA